MKLSDAIRKGAEQRPKCSFNLFAYRGGVLHSCALGAAYEAVFGAPTGYQDQHEYFGELVLVYPELDERPAEWGDGPSLAVEITFRNDHHGESREAIAEWLKEQGL
jgi:hypothetical protein